MTGDVVRRVDHLEWEMAAQADKINTVSEATSKLESSLLGIENNINQIKWLFAGMGLAYLLGEFGIVDVIGAII